MPVSLVGKKTLQQQTGAHIYFSDIIHEDASRNCVNVIRCRSRPGYTKIL